jgi:hypothetical protein
VQELINSLVRLSAAATVYTIQQLQTAAETVDPKDSMERLRQIIDSMTNALTAQLDPSKKPTVDSISALGSDVVGKTFDTLNVSVPTPADLLQSTNDVIRKTTDSMAQMMKHGEKKAKHEEKKVRAEFANAN